MATKTKSPIEKATVRLRQGSDRERALYVSVRKALAPRLTRERARVAKGVDAGTVSISQDAGFRIFAPGTFPEAAEVVADAKARLAQSDLDQLGASGKQFMRGLVDQKALDRDSPLLRMTLREDVLAAVADYLGTTPLLTSVNVYLSRSTGRENISSQLLHCDGDDTKQVKLFVLASNVTEANGPLMMMDSADSERLRRSVDYRYKDRVTDDQAKAEFGDLPMTALEGPEGSVCLVDTSRCFHFGSRVGPEAEPRLSAMIQFLTPHSFMLPRDAPAEAPFRHLAREDDPEIVRLVLGA